MEIKLDKLEKDILDSLKKETGKSEEDIVKLALYELDRKMMHDKLQRAQESQPITIPVPYPVYPDYPGYPYTPVYPTYPSPWDTSPWSPYREPYIIYGAGTTSDKIETYGCLEGTYADTSGYAGIFNN